VIRQTGVNYHYTFPSVAGLFGAVEKMIWHGDEPFSTTSYYAEWCVYNLISENAVKVTLDGHGSDEILAGYHSFFGPLLAGMIKKLKIISLVREMGLLHKLHNLNVKYMVNSILNILFPEKLYQMLVRKLKDANNNSSWIEIDRLKPIERNPFRQYGDKVADINKYSLSQLIYTSLPMQLHWTDRSSMAHSIECRVPFLDYRLVEFVMGCPEYFKIHQGWTKRLLREAMKGTVPAKIVNRIDKMGFVTPEEVWVKEGDPKGFLNAVEIAVENSNGLFNKSVLAKAKEIINGDAKYDSLLCRIIAFGTWVRIFNVEVP